jgi:hypothetical protein
MQYAKVEDFVEKKDRYFKVGENAADGTLFAAASLASKGKAIGGFSGFSKVFADETVKGYGAVRTEDAFQKFVHKQSPTKSRTLQMIKDNSPYRDKVYAGHKKEKPLNTTSQKPS